MDSESVVLIDLFEVPNDGDIPFVATCERGALQVAEAKATAYEHR